MNDGQTSISESDLDAHPERIVSLGELVERDPAAAAQVFGAPLVEYFLERQARQVPVRRYIEVRSPRR